MPGAPPPRSSPGSASDSDHYHCSVQGLHMCGTSSTTANRSDYIDQSAQGADLHVSAVVTGGGVTGPPHLVTLGVEQQARDGHVDRVVRLVKLLLRDGHVARVEHDEAGLLHSSHLDLHPAWTGHRNTVLQNTAGRIHSCGHYSWRQGNRQPIFITLSTNTVVSPKTMLWLLDLLLWYWMLWYWFSVLLLVAEML